MFKGLVSVEKKMTIPVAVLSFTAFKYGSFNGWNKLVVASIDSVSTSVERCGDDLLAGGILVCAIASTVSVSCAVARCTGSSSLRDSCKLLRGGEAERDRVRLKICVP
jgi:hypothetical protein